MAGRVLTVSNLAHSVDVLREALVEVPVHDGGEDLGERGVLEGVHRDDVRVARQATGDHIGATAGRQHG